MAKRENNFIWVVRTKWKSKRVLHDGVLLNRRANSTKSKHENNKDYQCVLKDDKGR